MHPFRNEILHVDFQRVEEDRKIHMKVPLHFTNGENSPAVKVSGAIVSHVVTELDVSCLPKDLPEFIEVDLSTLDIGNSVHVSALKLPSGVTVVTRGKLDPVVASAVIPKAHVEEVAEVTPEAEAAAAAAATAAAAAPGAEGKPAAEAKGPEKKESAKEDRKK
jgi:large subunit ribosomal protein L25